MKRILFSCIITLAAIACNNGQENPSADTVAITQPPVDSPVNTTPPSITGCFLRVTDRDTLVAALQQVGDSITGRLSFDNYQKDGSSGFVKGVLDSGILKLVYRFEAEGMKSVSEQYFKVTPEGLIQGLGQVQVKGDSAYFSSPADLSYDPVHLLRKTDCINLPEKFR